MYSKLSQTTISRAQGVMTSTDRRTPAGGAAGVAHEVAFTTADKFQRRSMSSRRRSSHRPTRAAFGSNAAQIGRRLAHSSARAPDDRRLPAPVRTRARDVEA
jgi:hypothetical protein